MKLNELIHRGTGLKMNCRDSQLQLQSEQKASHIIATNVAKGSLLRPKKAQN